MIKGQKPFLDYKIDPDACLNFSSDQFSVQGEYGRRLRPELLYPVNDKDPAHPARKRTYDSYKLGLELSAKVDEEQARMRRQEMEEDAKYDPVPKEPVMPEPDPLEERIHLEDVGYYELAGGSDGKWADG